MSETDKELLDMDRRSPASAETRVLIDRMGRLMRQVIAVTLTAVLGVGVGLGLLILRDIHAGEQRAVVITETQRIESKLVCFAERQEKLNLIISAVLELGLVRAGDQVQPGQQAHVQDLIDQLADYREAVEAGALECVDR